MKSAAGTTLAEARRRGVNISEREGRLAVDSPREAFTPELRGALLTHKAAILDLLRAETSSVTRHSNEPPEAELNWRTLRLSKAKGVLAYLKLCGIAATLDMGRLAVSDPEGKLTDEDRKELASFESELVDLLSSTPLDRSHQSRKEAP